MRRLPSYRLFYVLSLLLVLTGPLLLREAHLLWSPHHEATVRCRVSGGEEHLHDQAHYGFCLLCHLQVSEYMDIGFPEVPPLPKLQAAPAAIQAETTTPFFFSFAVRQRGPPFVLFLSI